MRLDDYRSFCELAPEAEGQERLLVGCQTGDGEAEFGVRRGGNRAVGEGRVSARIVTARREAVREFLAADGALLLDDNVFHQYFFLARRRGGLPLPVIVPRRNVQEYLRCAERGQETIDIAGHAIVGAVFAVTGPDGVERQVWVDTEGRVLHGVISAARAWTTTPKDECLRQFERQVRSLTLRSPAARDRSLFQRGAH